MSGRRQWYAAVRNAQQYEPGLTGYRELWYAVLLHALETVRHYPASSAAAQADLAWLRGAAAPLPCVAVCDALGINHGALLDSLCMPMPMRYGPRPNAWANRAPVDGPRPCRECGALFLPKLETQIYCCHIHQHRAYCRGRRARLRQCREVA